MTASRDGVQVPCGRGMSPLEDDSAKSQSLREHAERSGRALGFKRLSVRLIDYEVTTSLSLFPSSALSVTSTLIFPV